ncbi:mis18-binding protein 1 [Aplochiton taeniatus]
MVNAKKISHPPLPLFGDVSQTTNGTVFKGLPTCVNSHEDSCRKWVFEEPGILKDVPPLLKACVVLERLPSLQSPAKLFAKMKDRESKKELQVFSHTNCHTKDNWKQYQAFDQCRESATPNNIEAEEETCMDTEGINLMQWILKFNGTGLFVDGLRRDNNMAWHSNIIAERVSSTVVKTVSGSTYCLIGKMSSDLCSTLPSWLLKKFDFGFPQKWKSYLEEFLSESKGSKTESSKRNKERPASEKYSSLSTTQQTLTTEKRKPNQTPTHCLRPTAIPSQRGGPQVSRSGRVIKTPLEYWKGGRIILDCDMNVTIHESYNTSICESQISIPVTRRKSQKTKRPASVFLSPSEDFRLSKAGCKEDVSVPVRKIKVLHRHRQHSNPDDCKSSTNKAPISVESSNHSNNHTSPTCSSLEPTSHTSKQTYNIRSRDLTSPEMSLQRELPVVPIRSELRRGRSKVNRPAVVEQSDEEVQAGGYDSVQTASSSDDDFTYKRKPKGKMAAKTGGTWKCLRTIEDSQLLTSCDSSEGNGKSFRIKGNAQKSKTGKSTWAPQPRLPEVLPEGTQSKSSKTKESKKVSKAVLQDEEDIEDNWTEPELLRLHEAVTSYPKNMSSFWSNVAMAVGTRFAEECQQQYMSQKSSQTSTKAKKVKEAPQKKEQEPPSITAKVGTLKRKQQVRQLLDHMPKDDHDDIFNSSRMRNKRVQLPTVSPTGKEHVFLSSNPQTPGCLGYPTAKTPQCLHITPGMMGSVNRNDDDKYIYQLQKRMKKDQAKVHKHAPLSKKFTPSPSVKRAARRCTSTEENDSFVVWEMFPEVGAATVESGDEEDYYFTDD